jgi:hypothetical protein
VIAAADELTLVQPVEPSPRDVVLLEVLGALLAVAHRAPSRIWLAQVIGACGGQIAVAAGPGDAVHEEMEPSLPFVVDRATATRNPFAMLRRPPLVLSIAHPLVAAARRRPDPSLAASHLARAVLLHYRLLDLERSEKLLDHMFDRFGVP